MDRHLLRDDPRECIPDRLPGKAIDPVVTAKDHRLFVEAVLWIARPGAPWRDLQTSALRAGFAPEHVIADQGYDANALVEAVPAQGAQAVIPPRSHRLTPRE